MRKQKNNNLYPAEIEVTITLKDGTQHEQKLTVQVEWVNNGIGSYEYWGAKCQDNQWEWELFDVNFEAPAELEEQINQYIDDNYDRILELALDKVKSMIEEE